MALLRHLLISVLITGLAASTPSFTAPGPMVDTSSGRVAGLFTEQAQVFRSIPYARPPTGQLRWKDPLPPFPVPGILPATEDPPGCPQTVPCDLPLPEFLCPKKVSEDCLYLNIFTPLTAKPTSGLPVMVFIHGGNFIRGYSGGLLYDGQYITNTSSTIVVTVNYRLGAIGFLVFGEGDGSPRGNYGLKDQRLALEWIQTNIANFGGDPGQITLWGQSAGAVSIAIHMTSVKSGGLFSKAIAESDPFSITLKNIAEAKKLGRDFAKELGCSDDVACLYTKDIAEISKAQEAVMAKIIDIRHLLEVFLQWTPIVDGVDVMDQPLKLFVSGRVAPMPLIIGTTSEETTFFIYSAFTKPATVVEYDALQLTIFGKHYKKVHKRYPPASDEDNRPRISVMGTEYTFLCPTRFAVWGLTNQSQASQAKNPLWLYTFNHSMSFDWGDGFEFCDGHSCHGVELPFVFHTATLGGLNYTDEELVLTDSIVKYWTNFAHQGNPNDLTRVGVVSDTGHTHPQRMLSWPQYYVDTKTGTLKALCMRFKTPQNEVIADYLGDTCRFWDSVGYNV